MTTTPQKDTPVLQQILKDSTEAAGLKATVATASIFTTTLGEKLCAYLPVTCPVLSNTPDRVLILAAMMALDLITGMMAARAEGQVLQSRKMATGMYRKFTVFLVIAGTILIEQTLMLHGIPTNGLLYKWTATWFIVVEFLSLYENAERMKAPVPKFLRIIMERLLKKAEAIGEQVIPEDRRVATEDRRSDEPRRVEDGAPIGDPEPEAG
jgi:toxin secretion/phage lysis holin